MSDISGRQRTAERCAAKHLLDYEIISPQGEVIGRGLARTLNVSSNGLLLETGQQFAAGQTLRITLELGDTLVPLTGSVVHSGAHADELCRTGVHFLEIAAPEHATYRHYLEALHAALSP